MALYDGDTVAAHGAVFVNLNYRVGALGFMAHPQLSREQGGHFRKLRLPGSERRFAVDPCEHRAPSGVIPSKVLLAGQSFGAGSVAAQMFSPSVEGTVSRRGHVERLQLHDRRAGSADSRTGGPRAPTALGCGQPARTCVRAADRILAQQTESQVGAKVQAVRTPPLIDGYFTVGPREASAVNVPIMVSSNGDDLDANMSPLTRAKTVQEYEAIAHQLYGADAAKFLQSVSGEKGLGCLCSGACGCSRERHVESLTDLRTEAGRLRGVHQFVFTQAPVCTGCEVCRPGPCDGGRLSQC